MALIKCPNCGKEFSEHAKTCPQCGYQTNYSKKNERFVVYGIILLALQCIELIAYPSGNYSYYNGDPVVRYSPWPFYLFLLILYFMAFWIRQAKSLRNTTQSIYAYVLATLSLVLPIWGWGVEVIANSEEAISIGGVMAWVYNVGFLSIGILTLLYGLALASNNKYLAIASGSLWIISSLFLFLFLAHLLSSTSALLYGGRILPCMSIISTIVFIISCYLPNWKKQKSSKE